LDNHITLRKEAYPYYSMLPFLPIAMPSTVAAKRSIRSVLDNYVRAVETEDLGLYERVVDHNASMVNFGTDVSERIVGWSALRKAMQSQFAMLKGTRIAVSDVTVNVAPEGRFAWATSMWVFKATMGTQALELPVRCSWVLEQSDGRWLIVHFHKSVGTTS
jgi:uncharacterized protein (TIGR02246 family)